MTLSREPLGYGGVFAPLRDLELFRQVRPDLEQRTITWPGEVDIARETLYADAEPAAGSLRARA